MIKLEDLVREPSSFTLKKTGKTYNLKACTLADESWMQRTFGQDIEKIFKEVRMDDLARIVFRLLDDESKSEFEQQEVTIIDEEGKKTKQMLGGVTLLKYLIVDTKEKISVLEALLVTIGLSRPIQDEIVKKEPDEKKSPESLTGQ